MAIVEDWEYVPLAALDDPDDYRPNSQLAIIIDPARPSGDFVRGLTVFRERIAPGDRIPLHEHTIEELLLVDEGTIEVALGDERRVVEADAVVFIPARMAHGFRNVGEQEARIHAVFPAREVAIRYLERNPAPGTEDDEPAAPIRIDVRELLEGDSQSAVRPVDTEEFSRPPPR